MNVPDIGKIPTIQILDMYYPGLATIATGLTVSFNDQLLDMQWYFNTNYTGMDVKIFDAYPDTFLFWDGMHPTKAVHKIMADAAVEVLSTP